MRITLIIFAVIFASCGTETELKPGTTQTGPAKSDKPRQIVPISIESTLKEEYGLIFDQSNFAPQDFLFYKSKYLKEINFKWFETLAEKLANYISETRKHYDDLKKISNPTQIEKEKLGKYTQKINHSTTVLRNVEKWIAEEKELGDALAIRQCNNVHHPDTTVTYFKEYGTHLVVLRNKATSLDRKYRKRSICTGNSYGNSYNRIDYQCDQNHKISVFHTDRGRIIFKEWSDYGKKWVDTYDYSCAILPQ